MTATQSRRQSRVLLEQGATSPVAERAGPSKPRSGNESATQKLILTSSSDVRLALAQSSSRSAALDQQLTTLHHDAKQRMLRSNGTLAGLRGQVQLITDEARVLEERLAQTSKTAERISESVRRLDEEIARVHLARTWTEKAADLKASLQSMAAAIDQQDYAMAAQHCSRALSIDKAVLDSHFVSLVVPTSDYPDPPATMLQSLRSTLLEVFTERFEQAVEARNTVEATHFFTLFPQVGWKNEGLAVYSRFAKSIVRERGHVITDNLGSGAASKTNTPTHHANLLTILFENIALLVDQHQPLVDRHYGPGNFVHGVMPSLQEECDRLGKRVCDAWYEDRAVRRRLSEARAYNFQFVASIGTTPRKAAPAGQRTVGGFHVPGRPSTPSSEPSNAAADLSNIPDTREMDRISNELAAISARWGTYRRFLVARFNDEEQPQAQEGEAIRDYRKDPGHVAEKGTDAALPKHQTDGKSFAKRTALRRKIDELMETVYVPAETWFLRCSIEKAHRLDSPDFTARPMTSPLLDDVFYLVRLVLSRAVSTSNLDILATMCRHVRYIVDEDFNQAIVRLLDQSARISSTSMAIEGPRKDAATREMRSTFAVYLNVLSTSVTYTSRILDELSAPSNIAHYYADDEIEVTSSTLQGLSALLPRMRNSIRTHSDLLFSTLLRPKIRQVLGDSLRDASYVLDEAAFAQAEEEAHSHGGASIFVRKFTRGWEAVINHAGYRDILAPEVWETILRLAVDTVVQTWEQWVMGAQFSELGALHFDKDLRTVSTFLCNQSETGGLRERFSRLTHMSYLVNLDEDEAGTSAETNESASGGQLPEQAASSLAAGEDIAWRLSADEVKLIRQRRVGW